MDFSELVPHRGSIRGYKNAPVEDEKLQAVLEAARLAPTAHNNQPFRLIVMRTAGREAELSQIYGRPWFTQAPYIICIVGVPAEDIGNLGPFGHMPKPLGVDAKGATGEVGQAGWNMHENEGVVVRAVQQGVLQKCPISQLRPLSPVGIKENHGDVIYRKDMV